jgi:hypothetical protein
MTALCGMPWGVRALLSHEQTVNYMLERKLQAYEILLKKFNLISEALKQGAG